MKSVTEARVIEGYRVKLRFDDGATGEIDFSREPMTGVFEAWKDPAAFRQLRIGSGGRTLVWSDDIDLCADSLWLQTTGGKAEDIFPTLKELSAHA